MWFKTRPAQLYCFCDGSSGARPALPGLRPVCAAGAVARSADGRIVDWLWQELPAMTNNEAEYAGLLLGLQLACRHQAAQTVCILDSEVVVGQMQGRFSVNSPRLRAWHARAVAAARQLPAVAYHLVPREWNRLADGLAAQAALPWPRLLQTLRLDTRQTALPPENTHEPR